MLLFLVPESQALITLVMPVPSHSQQALLPAVNPMEGMLF